ncbi:Putative regulatory protein OS=Streptomyces griseus subsp. griseus (strain JCM 4626 / NBRC)OX=455632 GN=SGR_734 PE=4 SV=1 [Streptomyces griseus subsp. griseus]
MGTSPIPVGIPGIPTQQVGIPHRPESPLWNLDASILLVEDDAGDALLVEEMLTDSELDSALTWCKTLTEARAFLSTATTPVCVLLDLHLPDAHGLDAVRQILESDSDAAIVVLTGLEESGTGLRAVAQGAQDYLVKGRLGPEVLSRAVRYALQRKEVERAAAALRANQLIAQENARLEARAAARPPAAGRPLPGARTLRARAGPRAAER